MRSSSSDRKRQARGARSFVRRGLGLALLGLHVAAALWLGCRTPVAPVLRPTGSIGGCADSNCVSDFTTIQVVGDFTDPTWTIPISPAMILGPCCTWSALLRFETAGDKTFKLVTNGDWDETPDFGWNEGEALRVGANHEVRRVTGTGTGIRLTIPAPGCYLFRLVEKDLVFRADAVECGSGVIRGRVAFENVSQPPLPRVRVQALQQGAPVATDSSTAEDGSFELVGLTAGRFDVAFRRLGYLDSTVVGVEVSETAVDLGTVRLREGCLSAYRTVRLAGDMTSWTEASAPLMEQVSGCRWEIDSVLVTQGLKYFKFLTDDAYGDDYGGDESVTLQVDSSYALQVVGASGNAIKMQFEFDGRYRFIVDEEGGWFRVDSGGISGELAGVLVFEGTTRRPLPVADVQVLEGAVVVASARSSAEDGSFRIEDIDGGAYDVRVVTPVRAPAHLDSTIAGVTIGGGTLNLGQILLSRATGSLQGSVSFSNVAVAPYPPASIVLRREGQLADSVQSSTSSGAFLNRLLKPGSYAVSVHAAGYLDTTFTAEIGRGVVDAGRIPLAAFVCPAYSALDTLQLAGRVWNDDPNDQTFTWNLGLAPIMEHVDFCRWQVSIQAANAADYRIKFISNQWQDDIPDFGGDETTPIPPDSTVAVIHVEAIGRSQTILIRIPQPGIYRFVLDVDALAFSYTRTGDLPAGKPASREKRAGHRKLWKPISRISR